MSKKIEKIMGVIRFPNEEDMYNECVDQFEKEQKTNEDALEQVFKKFDNSSVENILIKTIVLNNRYSAGLTDNELTDKKREKYVNSHKLLPVNVNAMAEHIYSIFNNKDYLQPKNTEDVISLVEKIRNLGNDYQDAYSFATKYCSWTFRTINVPIVDSYVKGLLYRLNKREEFAKFTQDDLNIYQKYNAIYSSFADKYLKGKKYKEIDKYLWQHAKNLLVKNDLDIRI